ncbi:ChaN family lipoprotein [Pararhodonellum marinum]|uniref:ChaN family lipoprotein n=1 Tax=Pararhodonellum marinum TaxID=2755358 RepID=UPI00188FC679|nr:ChaN family lipoprotein [Pararhodonellum marinum]
MKRISLLIVTWLACNFSVQAQLLPYQIFNKTGQEQNFEDLLNSSGKVDLILFGELHDNSLGHWMQLQLLKSLHESGVDVVLAGEFFERDDQLNVDEWFDGKLTDKNFESEAKLWNNYATDYKPLMLFAKNAPIPFVASNVPRKYASLVSREGLVSLEGLSLEAKNALPPLPIQVDKELPTYVAMKDMMHGGPMNVDFMVEAQALKDATMAYSLLPFLHQEKVILHINGAYHNKNFEGINWYINKFSPETSVLNLTTVLQEDIHHLEDQYLDMADFILVLPADSHKSY